MVIILFWFFVSGKYLEYQLSKNYGQIVYDYSGNNRNGINGVDIMIDNRDCIPTDRGWYLNDLSCITFAQFNLPHPISIIIWGNFDNNIYDMGRIFILNDFMYPYFAISRRNDDSTIWVDYNQVYFKARNNLLPKRKNYSETWVMVIAQMNKGTFSLFINNEVAISFPYDSNAFKDLYVDRSLIGGSKSSYGIIGYVWYVSILTEINVADRFLSTFSSNCFLGSCDSCNPSFNIPGQGTGCGPKVLDYTKDSNNQDCPTGYGCKGSLILNCSCSSESCEINENTECSCIQINTLTPSQDNCYCTNGQEICCSQEFSTLINGSCVCIDGYYTIHSGTNFICEKCMPECEKCTESSSCTSCYSKYSILNNGRCFCPSGTFDYFKSGKKNCSNCSNECETCENASTCLSCKDPNSVLKNNKCLCKEGYFERKTEEAFQSCLKCNESCAKCSELNTCLECPSKNHILKDGTCICPEGFWKNSSKSCEPCTDLCKSCSSFTSCLKCSEEDLKLVDGKCIYCNETCGSCNSNQECTSCVNETYELLPGGVCFLKCLNNMERIDGKCGCLSGFQVKNNVCKRIHFTMDIKVNKKNHLLLSFNESLLRTLKKKSVKIELENFGKLDFTLFTKNNRDFIVALKINRSIANGEKVSIELKQTIFSHRNSTLKIYHYSAFLNEFEFIQQDTQEFIKKFQTVSRSLVAAAFAFSFISNPAAAWAMIGTLQLLPYIPLSENYDDLVSKTFLISAGSFNVLPNLMIYMFSDDSSSAPYKQARSIGIDTSVFWINIGELVLPLMVIVSFWPVIFLSSRLNYKPVTKKLEKVLKNYKFSVFIRFWIQSHLDIGIYSIINLKSVKIT